MHYDLTMEENPTSYSIYPQEQQNPMMTSSDLWQSSSYNNHCHSQSFYFPSSLDSSEFPTIDAQFFNYPSSTLVDPYPHGYSNHYPSESYPIPTEYNSTSIPSSNYYPANNSYDNFHSIYSVPSSTNNPTSPWQWNTCKVSSTNDTSTSTKQPCLVCHEESSGYHFGAYTCESCKAFYGRISKDPNMTIKHSCETPLLDINKFNRKDCRACRKAKCEQVGMSITSKDRLTRRKIPSKSSLIAIENLLEQLKYELTYEQLSISSTLTDLFHHLDLPSILPLTFNSHSLYLNAINLWRNQYQYCSSISFDETIAVFLVLFYSVMMMKENNPDQIQFDKLIQIFQQEINRLTGIDHRLASRIKARFMKCYVALVQYYSPTSNEI